MSDGDVAQLGERSVRIAEAVGSIPSISTMSQFIEVRQGSKIKAGFDFVGISCADRFVKLKQVSESLLMFIEPVLGKDALTPAGAASNEKE